MKKIIYTLPLVLLACGQSQEELNKINEKRKADSIAVVLKEQAIKDSLAKIRANQMADSLANALNEALKQ